MTCSSWVVLHTMCPWGGKSSTGSVAKGWGSKVDNDKRWYLCVAPSGAEGLHELGQRVTYMYSLTTIRSCVGSMVRSAMGNFISCDLRGSDGCSSH
jgi:hypothetical protein